MAPAAWFPDLSARVICDDDEPAIRWSAGDPDDAWSNGWQMVIDGDNRGLYAPGTIVTNNGGPAIRVEVVEPGTHTLRLDVHWELIASGAQDTGFGSFSISRTHDGECD